MGNQLLITVLALSVFFGIINAALNNREKSAALNTYGYVKYTAARDIARNGIHISLKNRERNGVFNVSGSLDGGSYTVTAAQINDSTYRMNSLGRFQDTLYRIKTTVVMFPKPFPDVGWAVGLDVDTLGDFDLNPGVGNDKIMIDGRNHDSSGANPSWTDAVPGVGVVNAYDSLLASDPTDTNKIVGAPDVIVDPDLNFPSDIVELYIEGADRRFNYDPNRTQTNFSGGQWGTGTSPEITYINAGDSTHSVKITGNTKGYGILVINGNAVFNGGLEFHGLVILYGSARLDFDDLGNTKIIGSLLMTGGNGSTFYMNGNASILYSKDALQDARFIGRLLAYRLYDWYE